MLREFYPRRHKEAGQQFAKKLLQFLHKIVKYPTPPLHLPPACAIMKP